VSLSPQHTSKQLKEIIDDKNNMDQRAREVQEYVEDGKEVLNPENTSSVLNPVLNTITNEFEHECLNEAVRLPNAGRIPQSPDVCVPGCMYSIPGQCGTKCLVHQVWAIWFVMARWVWNADVLGALLTDEMGIGKTCTSVGTAKLCKLVTEIFVNGLPLFILWGITIEEWVILAHNHIPSIVGEEREWYPLQKLNSVPHRMLGIQLTLPQGHRALISALKPILVVTMPGEAQTVKRVFDNITHQTDFKLVNVFQVENVNLTYDDLNTGIDKPEI
jgi:hypothetical protein